MPLKVFKRKDKKGVKNHSDKILQEAKFDEVILVKNGFITETIIDTTEKFSRKWTKYDLSGDIVGDILDTDTIELSFLNENYLCQMYSHWTSMELFGVIDIDGNQVIEPIFDEVDIIENVLFRCFYSDRENYAREKEGYNPEYGNNLYDLKGNPIWEFGGLKLNYDKSANFKAIVFYRNEDNIVVTIGEGYDILSDEQMEDFVLLED